MTDTEVGDLVHTILSGSDCAFGILVNYLKPIMYSVACRYLSSDDVEEVLQETFLNIYKAIRDGRYTHINADALKGWSLTILRRVIIYHGKRLKRQGVYFVSLNYMDSDGNQVALDVPDTQKTLESHFDCLSLSEFLELQLDKVLIESESSQQDKDIGLLKKIAFVRFYVDKLSQKEIVIVVSDYAKRLGLTTEINQTTINNWVSRGDILKRLIRYLIENHYELLRILRNLESLYTPLDEHEREVLRQHWELKKSKETIAMERKLPLSKVEKTLHSAKSTFTKGLFELVKKQMHALRHQSDA